LKLLGEDGKYKFLLIFGKLVVHFSAYKTWAWLSEPLYINWQVVVAVAVVAAAATVAAAAATTTTT
jgi:hypothetical protein